MNILSFITLFSFVLLAYGKQCPNGSICDSGELNRLHFVYVKMINFVESKQKM